MADRMWLCAAGPGGLLTRSTSVPKWVCACFLVLARQQSRRHTWCETASLAFLLQLLRRSWLCLLLQLW